MTDPFNFPNLQTNQYQKTSEATTQYNCVAWAFKDDTRWWELDPFGLCYWPDNGPNDSGFVASVASIFEQAGFANCDSDAFVLGREKVAIYGHGDKFTHVARQLSNGMWTSKLGEGIDISHHTLANLEGMIYGSVQLLMQR